jgi:8-oxo-dGTP pyrophosphatase MutT (NUDIX family)
MAEVTIVALKLPNGNLVFQKRGKEAPLSPGKIGLFGGHIEENEQHQAAIVRELKEETNLSVDRLKYIDRFSIPAYDGPDKENTYYLYEMEIPNLNFEVFEGVGAEAYSKEEALKREDLTNSARYSLENFI